MNINVKIYTNNIFLRIAITAIIDEISSKTRTDCNITIIDFGSSPDVSFIKKVILRESKVYNKILFINSGGVISDFFSEYAHATIDDSFYHWEQTLHTFLNNRVDSRLSEVIEKSELKNMSYRDYRLASMIKSNQSITTIGKILGLNRKTVYAHINSMSNRLNIKGKDRLFHFIRTNL